MGSSFPDPKFSQISAIENRVQWQIWIEMIGSEPVAIEERGLAAISATAIL